MSIDYINAVVLKDASGRVLASGTSIEAAVKQLGLAVGYATRKPIRKSRKHAPPPAEARFHALYVVDVRTDEIVGGGEDLNDCWEAMMDMNVADAQEARERFIVVKQHAGRRWMDLSHNTMNSGYYKGVHLSSIPPQTLLEMLERDTVDPGMKVQIQRWLDNEPDFTHRWDEQHLVRPDSNFLRDFTPSESRGRAYRRAESDGWVHFDR